MEETPTNEETTRTLTSEEIMRYATQNIDKIDFSNQISKSEQIAIYDTPENLTPHSEPDLSKYYYKENPRMVFKKVGVLKESPPGEAITKILTDRENNNILIKKLSLLKKIMLENQSFQTSFQQRELEGSCEHVTDAIFNSLPPGGQYSAVIAKIGKETLVDLDDLNPTDRKYEEKLRSMDRD